MFVMTNIFTGIVTICSVYNLKAEVMINFLNLKTVLVISILLFLNSLLNAQTAETDEDKVKEFKFTDIFVFNAPVKKVDEEKKWYLNFSGGYTEKKGNTNSTNTSYGCFIKYDDNLTELKLNYSGSYGKYNKKVSENKGTGTVNFDHFLFWRFEFFSYSMSDFNRITLLKHRNGTGAGAKFSFIRNNYLLLDLSGAPIFQYEKYEEQSAKKEWRWSVRGRAGIFPFSDDFSIRYVAFYIPAVKNKDNFRVIQDLYIYKKISGALGIKAGYLREYNTYDEKYFAMNPLRKKTDSTTYIQATLTL